MIKARKKNEQLDTLHVQHIDVESRRVYIFSDIDDETAAATVKNIHFLDKTDGEIQIYICTSGGEWDAGIAIYEAIKRCRNTTIGHATGTCSSMGSIILQACSRRLLGKYSSMLIHPGSTAFDGHVIDAIKRADWEKAILELMFTIYWERMTENSKISLFGTIKKFRNEIKFDTYLNHETALEIGLIDGVE